jgi:hypothetical protein
MQLPLFRGPESCGAAVLAVWREAEHLDEGADIVVRGVEAPSSADHGIELDNAPMLVTTTA